MTVVMPGLRGVGGPGPDPGWHKRYAYQGQHKVHPQHVLTAIAANIERPSQLPPGENPAP